MAAVEGTTSMGPLSDHTDPPHNATMWQIKQEMTAVGRKLEGLDTTISLLMTETKSIRQDLRRRSGALHRDGGETPQCAF
ncbi:hypothetical protein NDU88_005693 [Pleurodeles waltl]|uniref:Uncharacterized protein n=1 Tax=Pleurodeles waltl TaxID=8319 RepID=A0AAV7WC60_PLEWA|nr:hypothetical protein NDU88_005693 [Pleurodeles waltl]